MDYGEDALNSLVLAVRVYHWRRKSCTSVVFMEFCSLVLLVRVEGAPLRVDIEGRTRRRVDWNDCLQGTLILNLDPVPSVLDPAIAIS